MTKFRDFFSQARKRFRDFHGRDPDADEIQTIKQTGPEESLEVGECYGIMYKVPGIKEPYLHKFDGRSRPILFVSGNGRQIYVIGGKYIFTDRGFIG